MWILFALTVSAAAGQLGQISFPVSGNAACRQHFTDGMLAMHSFMYERAHTSFQAGIQADPRCAMARWGDAMAYNHPIWGDDDAPASRKALAGVIDEPALPAKERAFLRTARALFGEGEIKARQRDWLGATESMRREFPADDEVALQHALALIANSERLTDTGKLMRAAAIGLDVFARNPKHPGAAHYVIHAFDSPEHAILALPAAERYAQIAPAASHALHMPSHIFVQLGMWERVQRSNEAAWAASQHDARGKSIDAYDWHTYSWLVAAALELGQHHRAEGLLRELRERMAKEDHAEVRFAYSLVVGAYLAQTAAWDRADELLAPLLAPLPTEAGDPPGTLGCAQHAPGGKLSTRFPIGLVSVLRAHQLRAEAAMLRGDEAAVRRALEPTPPLLRAIEQGWGRMISADWKRRNLHLDEPLLAGARAMRARREPELARAAAAFKAVAEGASSGPAFDLPDEVVLGELALAASKPAEALASFEAALHRHPRTARGLLGAARAAGASAQPSLAQRYYGELVELWKDADPGIAGLEEARRGAVRVALPSVTPQPGRPGAP
jgi:hypothetical protein